MHKPPLLQLTAADTYREPLETKTVNRNVMAQTMAQHIGPFVPFTTEKRPKLIINRNDQIILPNYCSSITECDDKKCYVLTTTFTKMSLDAVSV